MDDLIAFLNARLDEDEAAAKIWPSVRPQMTVHDQLTIHGPARVLREVEAARRILERHRPRMLDRWQVCSNCRPIDPDHPADSTSVLWPCPDLRDLLARWADHPDYPQEWKP